MRLHDGTGYNARVLGLDKEADLALIKIDPAKPLPVIGLGTSSDLMVGEAVIAIGNAYGYEHSVTDGRSAVQGPRCDPEQGNGLQGTDPDERAINPE